MALEASEAQNDASDDSLADVLCMAAEAATSSDEDEPEELEPWQAPFEHQSKLGDARAKACADAPLRHVLMMLGISVEVRRAVGH